MSGVYIRFLYGDYADSPVHLVEIVETLSSSLKGEFLRRFSTVEQNRIEYVHLSSNYYISHFFLFFKYFSGGSFFSYCIQHCFICRPSNSTVPTDAGIGPGPLQLVHWQSDALTTRLDLIRWDRYLYSPSLLFCFIHFTISWFARSEFRAGGHGGGGGGQHRQPAPRAGGQPGLCPLRQEGRPAHCAGALRRGSNLLHTRRFSENCPNCRRQILLG